MRTPSSPHVPAPAASWTLVSLIAVASFLWAGCNSSQSPPPAPSASGSGKVVIKGSNTIGEELAPLLIAEFKKSQPTAVFELESKATGYGFAALMAGECDLAAASRAPIKDELDLAKSRSIELKEYPIGYYSVAVIVNSGSPLTSLTREQVRDIFTGVIQSWKDVGGPDASIHLCIRDPISGTYLGFKELAMENKSYAAGSKTHKTYAALADAVATDPNAIGYASFDQAGKTGVKGISIGTAPPTAAAVKEGKYPFARMLRFYTNKASEPQAVVDFLKFIQSPAGQAVIAQSGDVSGS